MHKININFWTFLIFLLCPRSGGASLTLCVFLRVFFVYVVLRSELIYITQLYFFS